MKIIRRNRSDDDRISGFICIVIVGLYIVNVLPWAKNVFCFQVDQVSLLIKIAIGLLFLLRIDIVLRRINKRVVVFLACVTSCVIAGLLFFPKNNLYFTSTVLTFISSCLPAYIMLSIIVDYETLLTKMTRMSKVLGIVNFLMFAFARIVKLDLGVYSMGFGYACLIPSMILVLDIIKKRSIIGMISLLSFLLSIVAVGSRGPLLALIFYAVILFYKYNASNKRYIKLIVFSMLLIVASMLMVPVLNIINNLLIRNGIQSRTLLLLTQGTIHLGNRDVIYRTVLDEIARSPFSIRGINAEYAIVGGYAHNLMLELIYQFGIIVGSIIVIYILLMVVKTLRLQNMNKDSHAQICLIFMCSSVVALMVSGSLWTMMDFWLWISVVMAANHKNTKQFKHSESALKEITI